MGLRADGFVSQKRTAALNPLSKKICLLGDFAVGKTSLMRRFLYHFFDDQYTSAIGVKVSRKSVAINVGTGVVELAMLVWDLAGSEAFDQMRASYLRDASGAVLVCDLTRPETLTNLSGYVDAMRQVSPDARFVVAANKLDLIGERRIGEAELQQFARRVPAACFLASAKTGEAVDTLFQELGRSLVN